MGIKDKYYEWLGKATADPDLKIELDDMDAADMEDAFYRDLEFGTGGLRGIIGAGTNRMNVYTVARASQGLCEYLICRKSGDLAKDKSSGRASTKHISESSRKENDKQKNVVIGYDSRIKSELFARVAAEVFAENGIKVHMWPQLVPVPMVSFAVRYLKADAGVMITASHNPCSYNGYKVYGPDGCQITTRAANEIQERINSVPYFKQDINHSLKVTKEAQEKNNSVPYFIQDTDTAQKVEMLSDEIADAYIEEVMSQSVLFGDEINRDFKIVYTPLNGAGLRQVMRVLNESGYTNITVVEEQKEPDGNFPTCPYPNPEEKEAMSLGIEYCKRVGAELLLATDPDSDRLGIAVKEKYSDRPWVKEKEEENRRGGSAEKENEGYRLLSGNEVGLLLLDYICSQRMKHGRMPQDPVFIKTIVTTELAGRIAESYGIKIVNVLTGVKFIGEQIGYLENEGKCESFIFGFEESYGYLTGTYVRDKDAVDAAFMVCEMFAYYKTRGISLIEKLNNIWKRYGYCRDVLLTYKFDGKAGMEKMRNIMDIFRRGFDMVGDFKVSKILDYEKGIESLPCSDVIKYIFENGCTMTVRPSGTEPKLKVYISAMEEDEEYAGKMADMIKCEVDKIIE